MDEEIKKKFAELEAKVAQLESTIAARLDRVTNYTLQSAADIIKYGNENELYQHLAMLAFFDERPEGYKNMSGKEVLAWSRARGEAIDPERYAQILAEEQRAPQEK
jgi:hypothetical protein